MTCANGFGTCTMPKTDVVSFFFEVDVWSEPDSSGRHKCRLWLYHGDHEADDISYSERLDDSLLLFEGCDDSVLTILEAVTKSCSFLGYKAVRYNVTND